MAVDTRNKRAGALQFLRPRIGTMPNPDGSLSDAADRAQVLGLYPGIVVAADRQLVIQAVQVFVPGVTATQLFMPGVVAQQVIP